MTGATGDVFTADGVLGVSDLDFDGVASQAIFAYCCHVKFLHLQT
ncbi:hypothetical protein Ark11_0335 [Candidatus Ichthyocystis hellenicum]|uniref:Uncharacterized protein n=1 Tax=Candidatus Ichthyocystis hellenicum TaxID=1561003 RepID=A0A0S4M4F7_9BURK|nr:hypothetical protein [Candidatus Ichthyocystis sparus]CUT17190.1 hypothetical protein Ark11_0335 [Candidatus Ichthyocystis hellenicum]